FRMKLALFLCLLGFTAVSFAQDQDIDVAAVSRDDFAAFDGLAESADVTPETHVNAALEGYDNVDVNLSVDDAEVTENDDDVNVEDFDMNENSDLVSAESSAHSLADPASSVEEHATHAWNTVFYHGHVGCTTCGHFVPPRRHGCR
ncbi:hypothetical protein PENTCL1PPCAC_28372, partial [Pristionchus entomophagus]